MGGLAGAAVQTGSPRQVVSGSDLHRARSAGPGSHGRDEEPSSHVSEARDGSAAQRNEQGRSHGAMCHHVPYG